MIVDDTGFPCGLCGVRPDVACRHKIGVSAPIVRPADPENRREKISGGGRYVFPTAASQGLNFGGRRPVKVRAPFWSDVAERVK